MCCTACAACPIRRTASPAASPAGIFVCYTPFYGFHFVLAGVLAYLMRGNILAALLATFYGNPLTFPIIATVSVELGSWMLGLNRALPLYSIVAAFSGGDAGALGQHRGDVHPGADPLGAALGSARPGVLALSGRRAGARA